MSTTALAVELVVIGYQALVWLGLAACLFLPCDNLLQVMKDWMQLVAVASVVPAYTLGAIVNGIASKIMDEPESRLIKCLSKEETINLIIKNRPQPSEARAAILVQRPEAFDRRLTMSTLVREAVDEWHKRQGKRPKQRK